MLTAKERYTINADLLKKLASAGITVRLQVRAD